MFTFEIDSENALVGCTLRLEPRARGPAVTVTVTVTVHDASGPVTRNRYRLEAAPSKSESDG